MTEGVDVVRSARSWLGTPYHHQGRLKGVGVDCAGLVIGVAHELGLSEFDLTGYAPRPDGDSLMRLCQEQMVPVTVEQLATGDVLLFKFEAHACHLGFLTSCATDAPALIHSYLPRRKVVEHGLDEVWWRQVAGLYRLPGVN
jgi:NlpC/P60 family putative phage cell wall peptidase